MVALGGGHRGAAVTVPAGNRGPLSNLLVLDLTQLTAGPMCTRLLADAGAQVVKVEPPTGDPARGMAPLVTGGEAAEGAYFLRLAANKRSIVLNLKEEGARATLLRLVAEADVLVEAFRPGAMERLGLGYATVAEHNPQIVYVSISGFGQPDVLPGPYSDRPAYDPIVQAMSGIAHVTGDADGPPQVVGSSIADTVPGIMAAYSTMVALEQRRHTGLGTHVDVAQYDTMLTANDRNIAAYTLAGIDPPRGRAVSFVPYGTFPATDGHVVVGVISDRQWAGFARAVGRTDLVDDARTKDGAARRENYTLVHDLVADWTSAHTRAEIVDLLLAEGVPAGPVQSAADIAHCPHAAARRMLIPIKHPQLGELKILGTPLKMTGFRPAIPTPPPALGEHTAEVLAEYGLDPDEHGDWPA